MGTCLDLESELKTVSLFDKLCNSNLIIYTDGLVYLNVSLRRRLFLPQLLTHCQCTFQDGLISDSKRPGTLGRYTERESE